MSALRFSMWASFCASFISEASYVYPLPLKPDPVPSTLRGDVSPSLAPGLGLTPLRGSFPNPRGRLVPPGDFERAPICRMFRVPPGEVEASPGFQNLRRPSGVRLGRSPGLRVSENFRPPGLALAGLEYAIGRPMLLSPLRLGTFPG